jgi:hypothetical protein
MPLTLLSLPPARNSLPAPFEVSQAPAGSVAPHPPLYTIIEDMRGDEAAEQVLVRDMVAVHGTEAAVVARQNARAAALASQPTQAKSWIRVLGNIQRPQPGQGTVCCERT